MKRMIELFLRFVAVAVIVLAVSALWQAQPNPQNNAVMALQAPPFVGVALAQEAAPQGMAAVQEEAGIAAYFDKGQPITLSSVRGLFRTIEIETDTYILGSMQVSGSGLFTYAESEDPHVYVNVNGWVMAYYFSSDPVSKIVDVYNYGGSTINTKLEIVLNRVAPGYTPTFYDFRYPNATKMLLVADQAPSNSTDTFTVNLPGTFPNYYERSWALGASWAICSLNGDKLGQTAGTQSIYGLLTPAQLGTDQSHTFLVDADNSADTCALAVVYRDVP